MGFTAVGISPTTVTTDQQAPLGFKLTVPNGDKGAQEWTYVKTSAELTVGEVGCRIHNAAISDPYIVGVGTVNTTRAAAVGVAQHTIASGSYGFVLSSGVGSVMANGSVTQGADIVPATFAVYVNVP